MNRRLTQVFAGLILILMLCSIALADENDPDKSLGLNNGRAWEKISSSSDKVVFLMSLEDGIDEFLYLRIFAAGALGRIGPKAQTAREALRAAAKDPTLRNEAEWALNRIAGVEPGEPVVSPLEAFISFHLQTPS
jgi:hypothetical protein